METQVELETASETTGKKRGKGEETKVFQIRGPVKTVEALNAQVAAIMNDEGMMKQAEVLPILSELLGEHHATKVAPAIASHVHDINSALRVVEAQVDAIVAAYSIVEEAAEERASARVAGLAATINDQAAEITKLRAQVEELQSKLKNETNHGAVS